MMSPFVKIASLKDLALCAVLNQHALMSDPRYDDWKKLFRCEQCRRNGSPVSLETLAFCALLDRPAQLLLDARYDNEESRYDHLASRIYRCQALLDEKNSNWKSRVFRCQPCVKYYPLRYRERRYGIYECDCLWQCSFCHWRGDVDLVMEQTNVSKDRAIRALILRKTDIVEAIIDLIVS